MSSIIFVTGNKTKVRHAQKVLQKFNIDVESQEYDIDEIQSLDPSKIAVAKAKAAFKIVQKPLVVNDHFWSIPALGGFPGGYMKDVNAWFEAEDFLSLMKNKSDRSAILSELIVYIDNDQIEQFVMESKGTFANEKRGTGTATHQQVFLMGDSSRTFAERIDAGEYAEVLRRSAWTKFGEWYKDYEQKDI